MGARLNFVRWIGIRTAMAGLLLGLALAAGGLWLFLRDHGDFDTVRREQLQAIDGERSKVKAALADVPRRMATITTTIATERERIQQMDGVIAQLKELDNTWDKLTGDAQQKANGERRAKLEQQRADALAHVDALQTEYTRTGWERDGLEIELARLDGQLRATEQQSKITYYLQRVWNHQIGRMKIKGWVGVLLCLYLLGLAVRGMAMERPVGGPTGARR